MTILDSLAGKKTYIIAVLIAVINLLAAYGVITVDQIGYLNAFLGALGLGALRAGVTKS